MTPGALLADLGARTIQGLAVPYGPIGRIKGRRYRFLPGWHYTSGRVWLLRDHDNSQRDGHALTLDDRPGGLYAALWVRPGRRGDRMLADAASGRFGLSVGVRDEQIRPDLDQPGVHLVERGLLHEITLTDHPAF